MRISHIREFMLLASNRNFSKTAADLYMAQSALSRHIASMEEELGVQLINRSTSSFELTSDGVRAREGFQRVLDEYYNTIHSLSAYRENIDGELLLGIPYYDMNAYVAQIRKAFKKNYPHIELKLLSFQPEQAQRALLDERVDAIMCYNAEQTLGGELAVLQFLRVPYYVFFSKTHPFASSEELSIADLQGVDIVTVPTSAPIAATKQILDAMFEENLVRHGRQIYVSNFDEVPALVQENNAVFVAAMANPRIYQDELDYRLLEPERYQGQIAAVWKKKRFSPLIDALARTVRYVYS